MAGAELRLTCKYPTGLVPSVGTAASSLRSANSSSMRSRRVSCSRAAKSFPVLRCRRDSGCEGRERFADLIERQPDPLRGADHGDPAQDVGDEAALVVGAALAGKQALVGVPAHGRGGDPHAVGDLPDGQIGDVPLINIMQRWRIPGLPSSGLDPLPSACSSLIVEREGPRMSTLRVAVLAGSTRPNSRSRGGAGWVCA